MTQKPNRTSKQIGLAAALAMAALTAPLAYAQGAEGMRVAKDPVTGELRALTTEEHKALDAKAGIEARKASALRRSAATSGSGSEPTQIMHSGSVKILGGRMSDELMSQSVVVRMADGSLQEVCTDPSHAHSVVKALQSQSQPVAKATPVKALETE